jgi:hypothetical protein
LRNQGLLAPARARPEQVVRRLGAVQAQDYGGARWAVAQRAHSVTAAAVDDALCDGRILRTHVLRPTWHLVVAEDIRWLLMLTAPRVKALMAYGNRQSGLDGATLATANRALTSALRGGRQLTRVEIADVLRRAGIEPGDEVGLGRLMVAAELDGVVCSGALRGRQHTYALLEERAPSAVEKDRPTALAELAGRYLASHGPATVKDFSWWSGLSTADAIVGVQRAQPSSRPIEVDGGTYFVAGNARRAAGAPSPTAHLLPNFDEYTVGYADRTLLIDARDLKLQPRGDVISSNVIIVNGRVAGTWSAACSNARCGWRSACSQGSPTTSAPPSQQPRGDTGRSCSFPWRSTSRRGRRAGTRPAMQAPDRPGGRRGR